MLVLPASLRPLLDTTWRHGNPFPSDARTNSFSALAYPSCRSANATFQPGGGVEYPRGRTEEGGEMYIGGGVLALIVIVLLLVWLF